MAQQEQQRPPSGASPTGSLPGSDPPSTIRICFLGNQSAGKTTCVNALLRDQFGAVGEKRTTAAVREYRVAEFETVSVPERNWLQKVRPPGFAFVLMGFYHAIITFQSGPELPERPASRVFQLVKDEDKNLREKQRIAKNDQPIDADDLVQLKHVDAPALPFVTTDVIELPGSAAVEAEQAGASQDCNQSAAECLGGDASGEEESEDHGEAAEDDKMSSTSAGAATSLNLEPEPARAAEDTQKKPVDIVLVDVPGLNGEHGSKWRDYVELHVQDFDYFVVVLNAETFRTKKDDLDSQSSEEVAAADGDERGGGASPASTDECIGAPTVEEEDGVAEELGAEAGNTGVEDDAADVAEVFDFVSPEDLFLLDWFQTKIAAATAVPPNRTKKALLLMNKIDGYKNSANNKEPIESKIAKARSADIFSDVLPVSARNALCWRIAGKVPVEKNPESSSDGVEQLRTNPYLEQIVHDLDADTLDTMALEIDVSRSAWDAYEKPKKQATVVEFLKGKAFSEEKRSQLEARSGFAAFVEALENQVGSGAQRGLLKAQLERRLATAMKSLKDVTLGELQQFRESSQLLGAEFAIDYDASFLQLFRHTAAKRREVFRETPLKENLYPLVSLLEELPLTFLRLNADRADFATLFKTVLEDVEANFLTAHLEMLVGEGEKSNWSFGKKNAAGNEMKMEGLGLAFKQAHGHGPALWDALCTQILEGLRSSTSMKEAVGHSRFSMLVAAWSKTRDAVAAKIAKQLPTHHKWTLPNFTHARVSMDATKHMVSPVGAFEEFAEKCLGLLRIAGVREDGANAMSWRITAQTEKILGNAGLNGTKAENFICIFST
eukprot:g4703.t1